MVVVCWWGGCMVAAMNVYHPASETDRQTDRRGDSAGVASIVANQQMCSGHDSGDVLISDDEEPPTWNLIGDEPCHHLILRSLPSVSSFVDVSRAGSERVDYVSKGDQ